MQNNKFQPVVIGAFVAAIVIGAFAVGYSMSDEPEGPAERLGESLDKAAEELKKGVEGLEQKTN